VTVYRHTAIGVFPGETWNCTLHSDNFLGLNDAQAAWVAAWTALWNGIDGTTDDLKSLVVASVETTSLVTSQLDPTTFKQTARAETDVTLAGTATGESLPPQCAAGLTWETAVATRSGRGRMYLPVYSTSTVAAGRVSTAAAGKTLLAGKNLITTLYAANCNPVIFSRGTKVRTPITVVRTGDVFNTQRDRRDKLVPVYTSVVA